MNVVLLHGFGEDASVWDDFIPLLPSSSRYFCPDFSAIRHLNTIPDYAAWVKDLCVTKEWEEIIVIGHSMGGYIALELAKNYPSLISGLGLFHSTAAADTPERKASRDKTAAFIDTHGSREFISGFYPNMFSENFRKAHISFIEKQKERFAAIPKEALIAATLAMKTREDNLMVLKSLQVPVMMIIGGADTFVSKEAAQQQALTLSRPYTLVIDHVAHAGMFESPGLCAAMISEFLHNC